MLLVGRSDLSSKGIGGSAMVGPYKLRVAYVGRLNEDMDDSIIALVEKYGYGLSTTGYDPKTHERQLNFEGDEE